MHHFTSESVTPGHPDKVCDQISDAILDAYLGEDPTAHVACEVFATADLLVIGGEVSSTARVDHEAVARGVLRAIGWTAENGLDPDTYPVQDHVVAQSAEIADAVELSFEAREQETGDEDDWQGAGDQGLMFGYATNETPELMPLPIAIAHDLAHRLTAVARELPFLRPDGKTQVTIAYDVDGPRVDTVLVSTQHAPDVAAEDVERAVVERVVFPTLNAYEELGLVSAYDVVVLVNPSGSFVVGGPAADTGLTGRKIIVDTYGGAARHGGGAFSGKDPSKVDRSGAYAARWVAKNVVAAGLAERCEVQVAYAIGKAAPVSIGVDTFGTSVAPESVIAAAVREVFDLRPAAIIRELELRAPQYRATATFGHFGVPGRPWERLNKTQALRAAVGRAEPARV